MATKRSGLGRGLGALFGTQKIDTSQTANDIVQEVLTASIQPNRYQPRREFEPEAMKELAESIKAYGILQPIIIRPIEQDKFELIAGERRLRAAKIVGLEKVPVIIRNYTDVQTSEIAIIENVQRRDLNAMEEAQAYKRLLDEFGYTQEELAARIGRSRPYITNVLRLLKLAKPVQDLLASGKLSMGQSRPLLALEDPNLQIQAANMVMESNLPAKTVEAFMREFKKATSPQTKKSPNPTPVVKVTEFKPNQIPEPEFENEVITAPTSIEIELPHENYVKMAENKLAEILGTQVKIISDDSTNQIQISFDDDTQLLRIIRNLDKNLSAPETSAVLTNEERIAALRKFSTEGTL